LSSGQQALVDLAFLDLLMVAGQASANQEAAAALLLGSLASPGQPATAAMDIASLAADEALLAVDPGPRSPVNDASLREQIAFLDAQLASL
jgi:hypothetical protein